MFEYFEIFDAKISRSYKVYLLYGRVALSDRVGYIGNYCKEPQAAARDHLNFV